MLKKKRSLWSMAGVMIVILVLVGLSACGPTTNNGGGGPKKGGTITDGLYEEPDSLLPEGSIETFADMVDASIWAPLYYGDNTETIQPGLASPVPSTANGLISSDLKTYTIKLRPNLKWSNGTPLTADDVAFTLNLFAGKFGTKNTFQGGEIASVMATDQSTVIVHLSVPDVTFLALSLTDPLIFAPLPKAEFGSMDPASILKSPLNLQPDIVSGPFTIKERVKGDHITVKRNPNYYQPGLPYLDGITFRIIPNQDTILTALQNNEINTAWFLDVNKISDYKNLQGYHATWDKTAASYEAIYFNETNPILADLKVRQAISMSLNPQDFITQIWKGIAVPDCDDGTGTFAHDPSLAPCYKFDPAAAATLLTSDGWVMGSDGYRHKNGQTFELRYSTTAGKAYREQSELIAQSEWKQNIGLKIDIKNYPADTFFGTVLYDYSQYDIAEFANSLPYDPDNHVQWACTEFTNMPGGFNISHYCNPDVDAQIKAEQATDNQATRTAAFHKMYQDIITDLPAMYYYAFPNIYVYKTNIHNYNPSPTGPSETWNVWDWYLS